MLLFSMCASLCSALKRGVQTHNKTLDATLNSVLFNKPLSVLPDVVSPANNLTIEVLPSDEDEDESMLSFGLLNDAYGFGEQLQDLDPKNAA
ncbi:hypothetical protein BBOV_II004780 [Babesia bovis T2Bo]|uniref:Microprotein domain-containing protein n=1 Tax=Babesia bovis TaxID=5865 RepID=A7AU22_BABBO|nr:hypothetical protein BBOV_II004780 [Babesia bovis T2Bo]EDO06433.1 hypothetical protein BBOV_II004780 [Babesia bovis T2Bo]|eukprot:XP_001610001.1 hypothetical protein [Babesia bovis T2Bo]